ncbi:MAG: SOS response-associated peptidase family protein [Betaproteobacteria bacterium]|nr:SOS response-associated peptidase family protein [Betaproteobacteria bacterium]
MCANYVPTQGQIWKGRVPFPNAPWKAETYPGYDAPFVKLAAADGLEGALGRFGLVPWWTKPDAVKSSSRYTYNARSETVASKPSFRDPWKRRQFCVIPAEAIYEPRYDSGKPVRWRIERADREPLLLAGIWECWTPREASGTNDQPDPQPVNSFAMLTINADSHELMRHFHAPADEKRMVVVLEESEVEPWLLATPKDAPAFFRPCPAEMLTARPEPRPGRGSAA